MVRIQSSLAGQLWLRISQAITTGHQSQLQSSVASMEAGDLLSSLVWLLGGSNSLPAFGLRLQYSSPCGPFPSRGLVTEGVV